ncbi:MAG: sugar phosphate isomerase/epimerase family protein [Anaerolineae bacterium]|jgi:inosose dehydratase
MSNFKIGCGQITWSRSTPEEQVLSEIAQAGYEGVPASPRGGRSPQETLALLVKYGLKPAPGYLGASFWDKNEEADILERAETLAAFGQGAGLTELYVAAGGFEGYTVPSGKNRRQIAGHVKPEDAMTDAEFAQFAATLNKVGAITLAKGVRSCFHNHVGSTIETREEIDRLFSLVDRSLVFQGPDIGHLAWAGVDPVAFCRDYAADIKTMHVKDIDPDVLARGVAAEWDYGTFSDNGIFIELGEGMVDFPAIFGILENAGYDGWIIVETDVTQKPTALESATISRKYLKHIGY